MARILGIGGVFFKCKNPDFLAKWYQEHLGFKVTDFSGTTFETNKSVPYTVWGTFREDTSYFDPSRKEFMINLVVDDVAGVLEKAEKGGASIEGDIQKEAYGEFGWFIDPEGNKIELWNPAVK